MFIVAWCTRLEDGPDPAVEDHWEAFDCECGDEAVAKYRELPDIEEVYSATLAGSIASTDYETPSPIDIARVMVEAEK